MVSIHALKSPGGPFHLNWDLEEIHCISKYQVMWPSGGKLSTTSCSTMPDSKLEAGKIFVSKLCRTNLKKINYPVHLINILTPEGHSGAAMT